MQSDRGKYLRVEGLDIRIAAPFLVFVIVGSIGHLPRDLREQVTVSQDSASLESALRGWLDEQRRTGADYDRIHDRLETLLLRHLLVRFEHKPTALARALGMNRVTLRKKCREFVGSGD